jgi:hypothetical protein
MYPDTPRNDEKDDKDHKDYKDDKSIHTKVKEHNMIIEDIKLKSDIVEKQWRSCCFQLEPESSLFFAKLTVSTLIISLCGYQLITLKDCNYQSLYSSLLSSVITFWLSKK